MITCKTYNLSEINNQPMDNSGTVHIETSVNRNYTLGEFLKIWGIDLDGKSVKASVDGKPIADFRSHILKDIEWITLEIEANKRI